MKTLFLLNPIHQTTSQFSPPLFLFNFSSLSRENNRNKKFLHISHSKSLFPYKPLNFPLLKSPPIFNSLIYGGWDESRLGGDWVNSGESTLLRDFLVSIGINDKKHVFTFLLGFFCAFAISRIRVSSIIVFPASVLVFGIGFSFGFIRGGSFNEFSLNASKRKAKEEIFRIYSERLRNLAGFFEGIDDKVNVLKSEIQRAIDTRQIELSDLNKYVNVIKSIKLLALNARSTVEENLESVGSSNEFVESQKSGSKKGKDSEIGFQLLQFVTGLFGDSKPSKLKEKENIKRGFVDSSVNDQSWGNSSAPVIEGGVVNAVDGNKGKRNSIVSENSTNKSVLDWDEERRIKLGSTNEKMNLGELGGNAKRFVDSEEYYYQKDRSQFVHDRQVSWRMDQNDKSERMKFNNNLLDSVDFSISLEHTETEASFVKEQMFKKSSRAYRSSHGRTMGEDEIDKSQFRAARRNDDLHFADDQSVVESEVGSSSSSVVSNDLVFNRYLTESKSLLKQAKDCMRGRCDEEHAEIVLYKSAKLLCKATAMKPMSLLAVGQLGNTYLLHGELKLRISRELRTVLSGRDPSSVYIQGGFFKGLDDHAMNKDKIASVLVNVCEECEELLVEAGRKYRLALSIDGNDVRALYNWGLALSFRAQLISDIGPEAAFDADQVFLAAIDKFDAMMSKGNFYAPDALFRWGVVLQQRSQLRPTNSKEKVKLLQQAKRLYEDALHMDSDNLQVKDALSSCISELNHRFF